MYMLPVLDQALPMSFHLVLPGSMGVGGILSILHIKKLKIKSVFRNPAFSLSLCYLLRMEGFVILPQIHSCDISMNLLRVVIGLKLILAKNTLFSDAEFIL